MIIGEKIITSNNKWFTRQGPGFSTLILPQISLSADVGKHIQLKHSEILYPETDSGQIHVNNFYFPGVGDTVRDDVTLNTATVVLTQFTALNKLRVWIKNST